MSTEFWHNPTFWIFVSAWWPFFFIALLYGFGSPWWKSPIGRALMLTTLAIVLVLTNALITLMFPQWLNTNARILIRGVLMGLVTLSGWYEFVAILRERFRKVRPNLFASDSDHSKEKLK